jgi:hypothetical protein
MHGPNCKTVKRVEKCFEVDGGIFEHLIRTVAIY